MNGNHFDVIVVGSGAGGCASAYELARAGLSVALVEKGGHLARDGSTLDVEQVVRRGLFKSHEAWNDSHDRQFFPEEYFNVGGKTKWYGAALLRFAREEFDADPTHGCRGFPISYDELAPYYEEIERLLGVREFEAEPDLARLSRKLVSKRAGWRVQPLPMALSPDITNHAAEVSRYDGFASVANLKADGETALLARVKSRPNLQLHTRVAATGLLGDPADATRIRGVRLADGRHFYADSVFLAAGALHSPRLLQRYLEHTGLSAGLPAAASVGRYCKLHLLTAMLALSPGRKHDALRKTRVLLSDAHPHSSIQPLGFDGSLIGELLPRALPRWVRRAVGARAYGFFLQTEDGSHPDNRVIDAAPTSRLQLPKLDYDRRRVAQAHAEHARLVRDFRRALGRIGLLGLSEPIGLAGTAHACGTLAAGRDETTSVVDGESRVHGMSGLYVVDGSVLPRSSRVNPSLTIYAWSLRAARRYVRSTDTVMQHERHDDLEEVAI